MELGVEAEEKQMLFVALKGVTNGVAGGGAM